MDGHDGQSGLLVLDLGALTEATRLQSRPSVLLGNGSSAAKCVQL